MSLRLKVLQGEGKRRTGFMATISMGQAQNPLVLSLDVGSSSLRASLFDGAGHSLDGLEIKTTYQLDTTPDGGVEKDPDELLGIAIDAIDQLLAQAGPLASRIEGVALDTFWHSLMGIDREGHSTTPLLTWADTRSAAVARQLTREVDEHTLHSRVGVKIHPSYFPSKLRWLAAAQPTIFRRTRTWLSFGEYFYLKIFGRTLCSISMASGTGLFDQNKRDWDPEALALSGITAEQLPSLGDTNTPFKGLLPEYALRWPVLANIPWFLAVGDGAAGNLGSGCFSPDRIAVMVGTSGAMRVVYSGETVKIPWGLWCYHADYRRFVIGGALSEGGNLFAWMRQNFQLPSIEESELALSRLEPDGHGLTVLPFLTGERSPGWNASARAAIVGLSLDTSPLEIMRAGLESIAYRFGILHDIMADALPQALQIIASGGALLNSPTWMQILADVLNRPVTASAEGETTSRGAALLALEQLGVFGPLPEVPVKVSGVGSENATTLLEHKPAPVEVPVIQRNVVQSGGLSFAHYGFGQTYQPNQARHARYTAAIERQKQLYNVLVRNNTV
ncbi:MAG: carbohydrate kinase [Chloroflexi bacterium]|nr:carbohydrate kinase [Chloroflexota bacterium]